MEHDGSRRLKWIEWRKWSWSGMTRAITLLCLQGSGYLGLWTFSSRHTILETIPRVQVLHRLRRARGLRKERRRFLIRASPTKRHGSPSFGVASRRLTEQFLFLPPFETGFYDALTNLIFIRGFCVEDFAHNISHTFQRQANGRSRLRN